MAFLTYPETRTWSKAIKNLVTGTRDHTFSLDRPKLSAADIRVLSTWADNGALEGNTKDARAPIQWPRRSGGQRPLKPGRPRGIPSRFSQSAETMTSTTLLAATGTGGLRSRECPETQSIRKGQNAAREMESSGTSSQWRRDGPTRCRRRCCSTERWFGWKRKSKRQFKSYGSKGGPECKTSSPR